MTSQDKTGDQLVASIRKSKAGTVTRKTAARTAKPAVPRPKAKATAAAPAKETAKPDIFNSGRRVWPD